MMIIPAGVKVHLALGYPIRANASADSPVSAARLNFADCFANALATATRERGRVL